ncbi:hypothetical protein Vretifemale_20383 [Volvox reticuliferus]|uniref:Uncharacterized protein n=1 Tax=Volvox reticuliferus TaxID=1737510 RepID=A0A8J4D599_9CHLO|nr:hypothetical protein Vretifemale_20383 [Volvox reticuliferus]
MACVGSKAFTGYSLITGGGDTSSTSKQRLQESVEKYNESLSGHRGAGLRGNAINVEHFLSGVQTHLQYVLERGLLLWPDKKGTYPVDVLEFCPTSGVKSSSGRKMRRGLYLQYAGVLGRLCRRNFTPAPIALFAGLGSCDDFQMAGKYLDEYRAQRMPEWPPAGVITDSARTLFGIPEPATAAGVAQKLAQIAVANDGGLAGEMAQAVDITLPGIPGHLAVPQQTTSEIGDSPAFQNMQPHQVAAATTATTIDDGQGANMPPVTDINIDLDMDEWLQEGAPPITKAGGVGQKRRKRDEDDDDLGATGGRKKRTKPIKPVKKGAGSKKKEVTRAGRRPGGSNMDVSEEEWEDGDSGSTPSGTSSESGSSGGGIRQAVPVPQTARLKALTQKQARAGEVSGAEAGPSGAGPSDVGPQRRRHGVVTGVMQPRSGAELMQVRGRGRRGRR